MHTWVHWNSIEAIISTVPAHHTAPGEHESHTVRDVYLAFKSVHRLVRALRSCLMHTCRGPRDLTGSTRQLAWPRDADFFSATHCKTWEIIVLARCCKQCSTCCRLRIFLIKLMCLEHMHVNYSTCCLPCRGLQSGQVRSLSQVLSSLPLGQSGSRIVFFARTDTAAQDAT